MNLNRYLLDSTDTGFRFVRGDGQPRSGAEVFHYEVATGRTSSMGYQELERFPTEVIRSMMRGGGYDAYPGGKMATSVTAGTEREGQEMWKLVNSNCIYAGYYYFDVRKPPILKDVQAE